MWEERQRTTTKGNCMVRGNNDYGDYASSHPESEAAAALSDLEPEIPFTFGPRYAGTPPISRG